MCTIQENVAVFFIQLISFLNGTVQFSRTLRNFTTFVRYLSLLNLKSFYFAYVQSILYYGVIFWGSSTLFRSVFIAQKRALRSMLHLKRTISCKNYFKNLEIIPLPCLYVYNLLVFTKKNPDLFIRNRDVSVGMSTRGDALLRIPSHRSSLYHGSVLFRCIKATNKIPNSIKQIGSLSKYKQTLKTYLLHHCF